MDRICWFCVSPELNNETQARNEMEGDSKAKNPKYQRPRLTRKEKLKTLTNSYIQYNIFSEYNKGKFCLNTDSHFAFFDRADTRYNALSTLQLKLS